MKSTNAAKIENHHIEVSIIKPTLIKDEDVNKVIMNNNKFMNKSKAD